MRARVRRIYLLLLDVNFTMNYHAF
jgi:hypothetical protein